jgi:tRNA A-37 threonylcarbamoyl transferase component Bud32
MKIKKNILWLIIVMLVAGVLLSGKTVKELEKQLENVSGIEKIAVLNKLAHAYSHISVEKSLAYGNQALILARNLNDLKGEGTAFLHISFMYTLSGDFKMARESCRQALDIFERLDDENIYRSNAGIRGHKRTVESFKRYIKVKDDMFNEETDKQIFNMQIQYDALKREEEIESLKEDKKIQQLILERQTIIRNVSIIFAILVLIIAVQFIKRYYYLFTFWKKKNYIAHYKLVDKIASGGMGVIYKARDIRGKSRTSAYAVKVLKEQYFKDDIYIKRFKNEAALIDQLNHPNIVKVMERGDDDGTLYIAMELLEGKTLADLMEKEKQISLNTALAIMLQMAAALAAIHKQGIIHRDLKPENIMVNRAGEHSPLIKIMDFGLARTQNLSRLTSTGMIIGTIFYVAPEQLTYSTISPAGDIYSLGVICYQVLTGEKPFNGDTIFSIARQIVKKEPVPIETLQPGVPPELSELVKKMMNKAPEKRPSALKVLNRLKEIEKSTGK